MGENSTRTMTLPYERYRALLAAREFLLDLLHSQKTPRVPSEVRNRAYDVLRHFPTAYEIDKIAKEFPELLEEDTEILSYYTKPPRNE